MTRLTPENVIREMQRQKRRKGGTRRAHMEVIFSMAWDMAWADNFRAEPVDYVVKAEMEWQRHLNESRVGAREMLIKAGLDPGGL
jgi:hypothetical protein